MTKRLLIIFLHVLVLSVVTRAQNENYNVLSYYAVGNSLDGQLMIDKVNVLRFYPVFAMRDSVDRVHVTIYYGGSIFERYAESMDNGKYWQTLLPIFKLGEAIQRLEVDIHFKIDEFIVSKYNLKYTLGKIQEWNIKDDSLSRRRKELEKQLLMSRDQFNRERKEILGQGMNQSNKDFSELGISSQEAVQLQTEYDKRSPNYSSARKQLIASRALSADPLLVDSLVKARSILLHDFLSSYESNRASVINQRAQLGLSFDAAIANRKSEKDSLYTQLDSARSAIARLIEVGLTDTMYSGPSVRKSDIIIDADLCGAHTLYRNYKKELRYMPALDPAERMGIFRIRYVPFPVTRIVGESNVRLHGPVGGNFTVFEIGMSFGDAIVPGDEFVVPGFSWQRLGVAFAITEKMFSDSAQVIALALTYDFNSYGSIGVGGNFAQHQANPYVSFGINKKAFEAVLGGLANIFK